MDYPKDLKYATTHEWIRVAGAKGMVGISDFAQHELSDVVYVELPGIGDEVSAGKECAVVESVKSGSRHQRHRWCTHPFRERYPG